MNLVVLLFDSPCMWKFLLTITIPAFIYPFLQLLMLSTIQIYFTSSFFLSFSQISPSFLARTRISPLIFQCPYLVGFPF